MSQGKPLVSVVIPAYNAEKTIEETLQSVLLQTYENIEIIIVDDGSIDQTANIVDGLSKQHVNIILIKQENKGVAGARNAGIEMSTGEYIAPLDHDDLWHPKRIELHIEALLSSPSDVAVAYSPFYVIDQDSFILGESGNFDCSGDVFNEMLAKNLVGNGSGMTVRKDAFNKINGYSTKLQAEGQEGCEDYLAQLLLAKHYKYVSVPHYLIAYRIGATNMSLDKVKLRRSQLLTYQIMNEQFDVDSQLLRKSKIKVLGELIPFFIKKHGLRSIKGEVVPHISQTSDYFLLIASTLLYVVSHLYGRGVRKFYVYLARMKNKQDKTTFSEVTKFQPILNKKAL